MDPAARDLLGLIRAFGHSVLLPNAKKPVACARSIIPFLYLHVNVNADRPAAAGGTAPGEMTAPAAPQLEYPAGLCYITRRPGRTTRHPLGLTGRPDEVPAQGGAASARPAALHPAAEVREHAHDSESARTGRDSPGRRACPGPGHHPAGLRPFADTGAAHARHARGHAHLRALLAPGRRGRWVAGRHADGDSSSAMPRRRGQRRPRQPPSPAPPAAPTAGASRRRPPACPPARRRRPPPPRRRCASTLCAGETLAIIARSSHHATPSPGTMASAIPIASTWACSSLGQRGRPPFSPPALTAGAWQRNGLPSVQAPSPRAISRQPRLSVRTGAFSL